MINQGKINPYLTPKEPYPYPNTLELLLALSSLIKSKPEVMLSINWCLDQGTTGSSRRALSAPC